MTTLNKIKEEKEREGKEKSVTAISTLLSTAKPYNLIKNIVKYLVWNSLD